MANYKSKYLLRLNNKSLVIKDKILIGPSVKEWPNSVYSFNKNLMYETTTKDKLVSYAINNYFNSVSKGNKLKKSWLKLNRIFISIPQIKHSIEKINIDIYSYNKQKLYIIKILKKLSLIFLNKDNIVLKELDPLHLELENNYSNDTYTDYLSNYFLSNKLIRFLWKKSWLRHKRHIIRRIEWKIEKSNKKFGINKYNINSIYKLLHLWRYKLQFKSWRFINIFIKNTLSMKNFNKKLIIYYFVNLIQIIKPYINDKKSVTLNNLIVNKEVELYDNYITNIKPIVANNKFIIINTIRNLILNNTLKEINVYKYHISKLYINILKYNINNMLGLINILNKIYNKSVNLHIKNLKYLYLDNSILANAIVRKVNDRKKRILRVMKKILKFLKIPVKKIKKVDSNVFIDELIEPNVLENETLNYEFNNYINNYTSEAFDNLNDKYMINLRLQGSGRLTRRLTASRSILKRRNKTIINKKYINKISDVKLSDVKLLGYKDSNIQYLNINSYTRNGSFGLKSWISTW
jgi:hypothetical protein